MQNWESAAANYAAQQQAMGFPNLQQNSLQEDSLRSANEWQVWQQEYSQWQEQYGEQYEAMQSQMRQGSGGTGFGFGAEDPVSQFSRGGGRGGRGRGQGNQPSWAGGANNQRGRGNNRGQNQQPSWGRGQQSNRGDHQQGGWSQQGNWENKNNQQQQWSGNQFQQRGGRGQQQNSGGRGRGMGRGRGGGGGPNSFGDNSHQQNQPLNFHQQHQPPNSHQPSQQSPSSHQQNQPLNPLMQIQPPNSFKSTPNQQQLNPLPLELMKQPPPPPPPQEQPKLPQESQKTSPAKPAAEELSQAETEFDLQFKNWEDQFENWKKENVDHPDRQQYEEYESKMELFREQLLARREVMKKKRELEAKANLEKPIALPSPIIAQQLKVEEAPKSMTPKGFVDTKLPAPDVNKQKPRSIQDTLREMANYPSVSPAKKIGPLCVTLDDDMEEENPFDTPPPIPGLEFEQNDPHFDAPARKEAFLSPSGPLGQNLAFEDLPKPPMDKGFPRPPLKQGQEFPNQLDDSNNYKSPFKAEFPSKPKNMNETQNQYSGNNRFESRSTPQRIPLTPQELFGTLPADFNPWVDLGSDDELPPGIFDPPKFQRQEMIKDSDSGRWEDSHGRMDNQSFASNQGARNNFENAPGSNFRSGFGGNKNPMEKRSWSPAPPPRQQPPTEFDPGNRGPDNNPFSRMETFNRMPNEFHQSRGPGPEDRDQDKRNFHPEWEVEEYKAKTVIEYDHKQLNVVTPGITPVVQSACDKKRTVFKEPAKILDYSHTSEAEPTVYTPDPFDYDRTKYMKWEKEDWRRSERDRDRDVWAQDDRRRPKRPRNYERDSYDNYDDRERPDRGDYYNKDIQRPRDRGGDFQDRNDYHERDRRRSYPDRQKDYRDEEFNSRNDDFQHGTSQSSSSRPAQGCIKPSNESPSFPRENNSPTTKSNAEKKEHPQLLNKKILNAFSELDKTPIEELLCLPGRVQRPSKFAIFMRGPPGSGKSQISKLIKDKEVENGGNAPRILSLDDYFMVEVETNVQDVETGRKVKAKEMHYEYEAEMEEPYRNSLAKAFKKTVDEGYFPIIIVDCVNDKLSHFEEMWRHAQNKGFKTFVVEVMEEASVCASRNEHGRSLEDIQKIIAGWEDTPASYNRLDTSGLFQQTANNENDANEESTVKADADGEEPGNHFSELVALASSKWDTMDPESKLDKLDGIKKRVAKESLSMDDWLGLEELSDAPLEPGKKRVRWADIVERKEQEKMRAIGFVVGQTDWSRMMDPTFGGGALTRTKYF
ncbi:YLP motif-containing protein 1-like isoform X2 [Neocloeon triangulifer]|uniref:YLP motif-containing protein 1-like isoform X2 n=1 Tax=Neocloeon triangulifer TaxID=2078957 RepID=UPI00286EC598|nr:YLP motif-containing protein 1-like isoform X2 [Neocloeon triangulifer]